VLHNFRALTARIDVLVAAKRDVRVPRAKWSRLEHGQGGSDGDCARGDPVVPGRESAGGAVAAHGPRPGGHAVVPRPAALEQQGRPQDVHPHQNRRRPLADS
jgi:hypothetical protein